MSLALYEPGLGYYARGRPTFGTMPGDGSDFATAPEMSPLFGRALARQACEAFAAGAPPVITEFGAGSGALAATLLDTLHELGHQGVHLQILDLSAALRDRQVKRLQRFGDRVQWLDRLPLSLDGVVIGNEVLDAMPVQLLHWNGRQWHERGVGLDLGPPDSVSEDGPASLVWVDRPTDLRPPVDESSGFVPGTTVEIHPQAEAFIRSVAERQRSGLALWIDYGFPEAEYYHPQRTGGTLMCHRAHRSDVDPLVEVGDKDITAHVNFTGIALAAQEAGAEVLGYTSQARFLFNNALLDDLERAGLAERSAAHRLVAEHEMGELFKVLAFGRGLRFGSVGPGGGRVGGVPSGFSAGDRMHRL